MNGMDVLIVDDSVIAVRKLSTIFKELGHRVVATAANGGEALRAYTEYTPDLVTMDITMPDMDGTEAAKKIMAKNPTAKIIMITSCGQEEMVFEALKAGATGYVMKPFCKSTLEETLGQIVTQ